MKVIKPTKKEVFDELRLGGCCWLGGRGCECESRQLSSCYAEAEKRLTRIEKTPEEIAQDIIDNKKAMQDIDTALAMLHGEIEE